MLKSRLYLLIRNIIILSACFFAGMWFYFFLVPVITQKDGVIYYLHPGMSKKALIADLSHRGIIHYPILFSLYVYPNHNAQLKVGEYHFLKGSTAFSIWKQVTHGSGLLYHPFTIIPGWTFNQLRHGLLQAQDLHHQSKALNDKQIMQHMGQEYLSPEGEFYADTYYYTRGVSDLVILKRAFDRMQNKLAAAWQNRAQNLPYKTPYDALIAASLIEKEAYLNRERPVIAGVLVNRLKMDMLLQFDPTVIYGLGDRFDGKIHKENLEENNAYNTYQHKGLPPTPIAIPSMTSLYACLHPEDNRYLYFVARGDGSHQFSETLIQHHVAVAASKQMSWYFNEAKVSTYIQYLLSHTLKNISPNAILSPHE